MPANESARQCLAYVGLGSNLGPREETLRRALAELAERDGVALTRVSTSSRPSRSAARPRGPS